MALFKCIGKLWNGQPDKSIGADSDGNSVRTAEYGIPAGVTEYEADKLYLSYKSAGF